MIRSTAWTLIACAGAASVAAQPSPDRGTLLYETHCITCHTEQVHWRERRLATDWQSLRDQVRRWQSVANLRWTDEDIDAVARHLNQRHYGFAQPATASSCAGTQRDCPR